LKDNLTPPLVRKEVVAIRNLKQKLRKEQEDYFRNLFSLSFGQEEEETEAEMPVPYSLRPNILFKEKLLISSLKLSQKIGILLYFHRTGMISSRGQDRLLYLQEKAPLSAISQGVVFCQRLQNDEKFLSDFWKRGCILNLLPRSQRQRRVNSEKRRIGVGYRDKGTLPVVSSSARRKANQESFINLQCFPPLLNEILIENYHSCITKDGEWLDLQLLSEVSSEERKNLLPFL